MSSTVCSRLHGLFTVRKTTATLSKSPKPTTATAAAAAATAPSPPPSDSSESPSEYRKLRALVKKFKKDCDSSRFRRLSGYGAYEIIVRRLSAAQKFSYIEDILEHQKRYKDITNEGFSIRLISLYGKAGMFDHARKLFDELPQLNCERTVRSFNALLSACVKAKKFDKVGELLSELPEKLCIQLDRVSYNTVIKSFCELGAFDSALSVIDEMEKNGLEPDVITFNILLGAFHRNNKFADADKLWTLMEDKKIVPNVRTYNPKLRALVAVNRISEAVELIEEMRSKGSYPDVFSYNAVIKGFVDSQDLEEAKRWYTEMAKDGCELDIATVSMLGYFVCKMGDFDFALELCKEAISGGCIPYKTMMQLVVDGLIKESKIEDAKELVELGNLQIPMEK
ncbi:pentatricopeptide repeat-containing protein At3g13150-like [Diospyros lotus]|uniref:pentatricopeptide repeat-containing protein At3g13150-like n=1 Tax=Diospyros lotus TaxID=55363 RepID=UPI002255F843|nr:pentatricopeptide repeat-containing protein At3g13150-like [Diospyros lotus]XP_052200989.1 pentatricopeptide repeat-containing protein At3g13150-like [Diospyros lotus]